MAPIKRRKVYLLDGEERINATAKYRSKKKTAREEEIRKQIYSENPGDHTRHDDQPPASTSHCDTEISNDITNNTAAAEDVWQIQMTNDTEEVDIPEDGLHNPNNLQKLLQMPGFCDVTSTSVERSPVELLLMVLKYSLSNKLPLTATANLFKLINSIFATSVIPESRYLIDKLCNPKDSAEFHAMCPKCTMYIGEYGTLDISEICKNCRTIVDTSNPSSGTYFAIIAPF